MKRITTRLHEGFKFIKLPIEQIEKDLSSPSVDDSKWENVTVPHDWAIGHDFKKEYDITHRTIWADGILKPIEQSGRSGALPTVGIGWDRLPLNIPAESKGKIIELIFDGVMWECEIYLNLSGDVSFEVENRIYPVSPGTVILTRYKLTVGIRLRFTDFNLINA